MKNVNIYKRVKVLQDGVLLPDEDIFPLKDDGVGADLVAHDGLYSNYFVPPKQRNGDYKFKCKVEGSDGNGTSEAVVTQVIQELMHSEGDVRIIILSKDTVHKS